MVELISQTRPKSRKEYTCDACLFLVESDYKNGGFAISEYREIVKAKRNKWKILKGEIYLCHTCKDSKIYIFRAIEAIHKICIKYDFYPN